MDSEKLVDAARRLPPLIDDSTVLQGTIAAAASTAVLATNAAAAPGYYTLTVSGKCNFVFDDDSTIANPTDNGAIPAGAYEFWLDPEITNFIITANENMGYKFWRSGRAKK